MTEVAVMPQAGMPIPLLVVSVLGLAINIYFFMLKRVLPKDSQGSKHPKELQGSTDRANVSTSRWPLVIAFALCPLIDVTATHLFDYLLDLLWPLSYAFKSVLTDLPWFYALCLITAFPILIMYERYRGQKERRLIQGIIVWVVVSMGYEKIVRTFYETLDSAGASPAGGVIAGIFYWLITRNWRTSRGVLTPLRF